MISVVIILVMFVALLAAVLDHMAQTEENERERRQRVREATWQAGDRRWDR